LEADVFLCRDSLFSSHARAVWRSRLS